jgi:acetolactate synthase I/II/III large subunit
MRGAEIVASALKTEGVEFVAGVTGGSTMHMYDAIHAAGIPILVCRHERGAADIADGYARASGKPGVVLVEMGPGAINAMAGIANSYPDSVPVILLMGGVAHNLVGRTAYQENELMDIFRTVTKWEMTVPMASRLPEAMRRAFSLTTAPRPRPVAIEVPSNVAAAACDDAVKYEPLRQKRFRFRADPADINRAVDVLLKAEKPLILAGAGVIRSNAHSELIALAERLGIPVATSLAGKSAFPDNHPLALGLGALHKARYNTKPALWCSEQADVVLAIGAAFRQQATVSFAPVPPAKKIIQVDIDPSEFNKSYMTDVAVLGDAKLVLQDISDAIGSKAKSFWGGAEALKKEIATRKKADREAWMVNLGSDAVPINPHRVVWELMQVMDHKKSLVVHDSGSPRGLICYHWECIVPNSFVAFGNQSCMGWSVGAGIGAKLGAPDKDVVVFLGDGSFGMSGMEINTAVRNNIKATFVVINNGGFDLTRGQAKKVLKKESPDIPWMALNGDIAKVCEGLGAYSQSVTKPQDLRGAFERAFAAKEPAVVEVHTMKGAPEA